MTSTDDLRSRSASFLGAPVEAAGIFSAGSAIAASIVGAVGGATVAEVSQRAFEEAATDAVVGEVAGGVIDATVTVAGMRAAREVAAAAEGLTPVLLVAVTADRIVLMDWDGTSASGTGPTRELVSFARAGTSITFGRIGVNRKVTFDDGAKTTSITGALGWLSSGKDGKRAVLAALGSTDL